jgi:hypothetical protein
MADGLITQNPTASMPRAKVHKRAVDLFTREEGDKIIEWFYVNLHRPLQIYAA